MWCGVVVNITDYKTNPVIIIQLCTGLGYQKSHHMVVWSILPIIEPPHLTLFNSVLDWVVAIMSSEVQRGKGQLGEL